MTGILAIMAVVTHAAFTAACTHDWPAYAMHRKDEDVRLGKVYAEGHSMGLPVAACAGAHSGLPVWQLPPQHF